jgi:hypothetical protein
MSKGVFAFILCCACGSTGSQSAASGVALSLSRDAVASGDSITLVLRNTSDAVVGYNLCPSTLNRKAGGEWVPIPSDRVCTMELRSLDSGQEDRFTLQLPDDLEPGQYRFENTIVRFDSDERQLVQTDPFRVIP